MDAGPKGILCLAWSPVGNTLAVLARDGYALRLLAADTGRVGVQSLTCTISGTDIRDNSTILEGLRPVWMPLSWSPDGRFLAVGEENRVRVWDVTTGKVHREWETGTPDGLVAWSPDGSVLAVAEHGPVQFYDTLSWRSLDRALGNTPLHAFAWSPDSKILLAAPGLGVASVERVGKRIWPYGGSWGAVAGLAWSGDGKTLAVADGGLHLSTRRPDGTLFNRPLAVAGEPTEFLVAWSIQDETRLVSAGFTPGSRKGRVRFWDPGGEKLRFEVKGHPWTDSKRQELSLEGTGQHLAVSPDGHYRGSPGIEQDVIYVVQTESGQATLSPDEFAKRFGWKNDPGKVSADKK
jgi:WD40 repeat protein